MRLPAIALISLFLTPGVADAGTVSLTRSSAVIAQNRSLFTEEIRDQGANLVLEFVAAPGDADRVSVGLDPNAAQFLVAGPTARAGAGCAPDPRGVVCPVTDVRAVVAEAGDGDDVLEVTPEVALPAGILGGPGNDTLTGGLRNDSINGQAGNDQVDARGGDDFAEGSDGDDVLMGGPGVNHLQDLGSGSDRFVCGSSLDVVLNRPVEGLLTAAERRDHFRGLRAERCGAPEIERLGRFHFFFRVFPAERKTITERLEVRLRRPRWFRFYTRATCLGSGCRGLRLSSEFANTIGFVGFRYDLRGGTRVRRAAARYRRVPAVVPPARIRIDLATTLGYTKRLEFVMRANRLPRRVQSCLDPLGRRIGC